MALTQAQDCSSSRGTFVTRTPSAQCSFVGASHQSGFSPPPLSVAATMCWTFCFDMATRDSSGSPACCGCSCLLARKISLASKPRFLSKEPEHGTGSPRSSSALLCPSAHPLQLAQPAAHGPKTVTGKPRSKLCLDQDVCKHLHRSKVPAMLWAMAGGRRPSRTPF